MFTCLCTRIYTLKKYWELNLPKLRNRFQSSLSCCVPMIYQVRWWDDGVTRKYLHERRVVSKKRHWCGKVNCADRASRYVLDGFLAQIAVVVRWNKYSGVEGIDNLGVNREKISLMPCANASLTILWCEQTHLWLFKRHAMLIVIPRRL